MVSYRVEFWNARSKRRGMERGVEADPERAIDRVFAVIKAWSLSVASAQGTLDGGGLRIQVLVKWERPARKKGGRRG